MLHAAATSVGLFILAYVLIGPVFPGGELAAAAGIALAGTVFALRFGGSPRTFTRSIMNVQALARGAGRVARGAAGAVRNAVAADVALRPALIRIRAPAPDAAWREGLALAVGSAPGAVVVETDADGALVHVNDEEGADVAAIERMELRFARAAPGGGA